jgi:hypothetical protein
MDQRERFERVQNQLEMLAAPYLGGRRQWYDSDTEAFLNSTLYKRSNCDEYLENGDVDGCLDEEIQELFEDYVPKVFALIDPELQSSAYDAGMRDAEIKLFSYFKYVYDCDAEEAINRFYADISNSRPTVYNISMDNGEITPAIFSLLDRCTETDRWQIAQSSALGERLSAGATLSEAGEDELGCDVAIYGSDDLIAAVNNGVVADSETCEQFKKFEDALIGSASVSDYDDTQTTLGNLGYEGSEMFAALATIAKSPLIKECLENGTIDSRSALENVLNSRETSAVVTKRQL